MKYTRWLALVLAVVSLPLAAWFLPMQEWLASLSDVLEPMGYRGVALYAMLYAAFTVFLVPGSILSMSAGLVFELPQAVLAAWSGAVLGSALAFLVSRYLARAQIARKIEGDVKLKAVDEAIAIRGWKIVALLRLSPLLPFNISNYLYGLSKIEFWPYVLATAVGIFPGACLSVYIGAAARAGLNGRHPDSSLEAGFIVVGLIVTIVVSVWLSGVARRALRQAGAR